MLYIHTHKYTVYIRDKMNVLSMTHGVWVEGCTDCQFDKVNQNFDKIHSSNMTSQGT